MNKFLGFVLSASAALTGCGSDSGDNNKSDQVGATKVMGVTVAIAHGGKPNKKDCQMYESNIRRHVDSIMERDATGTSYAELEKIDKNELNQCIYSVNIVTDGVQGKVRKNYIYDDGKDESSVVRPPKTITSNISGKKKMS